VGSDKCVPSTFSWIEPDICFLKLDMYFQIRGGYNFKLLSMDLNHLNLSDLMVLLPRFLFKATVEIIFLSDVVP
jgi:hypothetical protein